MAKNNTKGDTGATTKGNTIEVHDLEKFNNHLKKVADDLSNKIEDQNVVEETEEMLRVNISKAKVKDSSIYVEYTSIVNEASADLKLNSHCVPHADLVEAMSQLKIHLIHLCDIQEYKELVPGEVHKAPNIEATSFTIGGEGEHEGIVITGYKKIGNKILNLNTPFTKFNEEFEPYEFSSELNECLKIVIRELKLFITEGKRTDQQLKLEIGAA